MGSQKASTELQHFSNHQSSSIELSGNTDEPFVKQFSRRRYSGAVLLNFISFLLPGVYGTLSKYWISGIDSSLVVTVDSYTYIGIVGVVINQGLPRAAWLIIGNNASRSLDSRVSLSQTLICFHSLLGLIISLVILGAAEKFAAVFVPSEVREASLTYVRTSAFSLLSSAVEHATSSATRALDRPDVPMVISITQFIINIVLDLLIISPFHIGNWKPSANIQAGVRITCDMTAAFAGICYFSWIILDLKRKNEIQAVFQPSMKGFLVLLGPGMIAFTESAIRNAIYLWLVANIVTLGSDFATAWGVFNTMRWGLVMAPVLTLEASSLAFTSHRWGTFRQNTSLTKGRLKATRQQLKLLLRAAALSSLIALLIEIPLCILLSIFGAEPYARFISGSQAVADITSHMWQTIDWCYIFFALNVQLTTVLLATMPTWYLYQSLALNILYVLPWAVVCQVKPLDANHAWFYYAFIFGGNLVVSFVIICGSLLLWSWQLLRGQLHVGPVKQI